MESWKCRQRRIPNFVSGVCSPILLLLLLMGTEVEAMSKAAVVAAAVPVVPPKAAVAPVVAVPPVVALPPKIAAAPVILPPNPAVAKPPVVVPPVVAPVVAKPPVVVAPPVIAPVAAKVPALAPIAAVTPVAAPVVAPAHAPTNGIPLDADQVKALNALGIAADADACISVPETVLVCDHDPTTKHLVSLNVQDCPSTAVLTEATLTALTPHLKELSFINCGLQGPLPEPTVSMVQTLTSLTVAGAPVMLGWWIGRLTNLETVHVQDAYVKASGLTIITSSLDKLTELTIANASVNGPIPTDWPSAGSLTTLDLSGNQLSGPIPIEITKILGLTVLDLSRNRLNDHIISGIGNLAQLTTLNLASNNLRLGIPKTIGNLRLLSKLDLSVNELNGTIPEELATLPLDYLDLSNNSLTGPIPFNDVFMSKLTTFNFAGNPGLCYNNTITSAKAAGGLRLCGAPEPALSPEYFGPGLAPEASALDSGDSPAPKKKPKLVVIILATIGTLIAVAAIVYCCCRYWGSKAGY